MFIFVEDACELTIEPVSKPVSERGRAGGAPARPSQPPGRSKTIASPAGGRRSYDKPDNASSLRVPAVKLDQFVDLVGELVTVQARLSELAARRDDPEVAAVSEEIERLTSALRENSMNIRMMPIRGTFEKFRRLVHDLARDLGKDVELTIEGAETELDKTVIDQLGDPLMHLIRNSMDHGIESAELRAAQGKRPTADDSSLRPALRRQRADRSLGRRRRHRCRGGTQPRHREGPGGGVGPADRGRDICAHLSARLFNRQAGHRRLRPGRGHGRGAAAGGKPARNASRSPASQAVGTSVTLRLPLTLAIIDGLLVSVGDACFVLPLANTLECIELTRRGHRAGQRQASGQCARRSSSPISVCASTSAFAAPSLPNRADHDRRNRGRGASALWWTRCWAIARRSSRTWAASIAMSRLSPAPPSLATAKWR